MSEIAHFGKVCDRCGQYETDCCKAMDQVDDVLMTDRITVKDGNYRKALADLVTYNIQIHDDPSVSTVAKERQDRIAELEARLAYSKRRYSAFKETVRCLVEIAVDQQARQVLINISGCLEALAKDIEEWKGEPE